MMKSFFINLVNWGNENGKVFTMCMNIKDLVQFKMFSSDRKYLYGGYWSSRVCLLKTLTYGVSYSL